MGLTSSQQPQPYPNDNLKVNLIHECQHKDDVLVHLILNNPITINLHQFSI